MLHLNLQNWLIFIECSEESEDFGKLRVPEADIGYPVLPQTHAGVLPRRLQWPDRPLDEMGKHEHTVVLEV